MQRGHKVLVSNNFSNLNSNKALSYKKNMNPEVSKSNSSDSFQKNPKTKNPSFGSMGELYNAVGPWGIAAIVTALVGVVGLVQKYSDGYPLLQNKSKVKARRAILKKQFLATHSEEAYEDKMAKIKARAIKIKKIRDNGTVVSSAVKKAAKDATRISNKILTA